MVNIIKDKEEVKSVMNIIQAFADGKTIQAIDPYDDEWCNQTKLNFEALFEGQYRIKPEPKYRPFANIEEGLQEILKHQPLWYLKSKETWEQYQILDIKINENKVFIKGYGLLYLADVMEHFNFPDGTPFGVKVED